MTTIPDDENLQAKMKFIEAFFDDLDVKISRVGWVERKRNPTTQIIHILHFHQNSFQHLLPNYCHKSLALHSDESLNRASQWVILPIRI